MSVTVRETGRTHDTAGELYPTQADAVTGAIDAGGGTVVTTVTLDVTVDVPVDPQDPAGQPVPVAATANGHDGNEPGNVLDGDPDTRWSHDGSPSILTVELAELSNVAGVEIVQFYSSTSVAGNAALFDVEVSTDGEPWTTVLEDGRTGQVEEQYRWPATPARFVRYVGSGRESSVWNSVVEFRPFGPNEPEPAPEPDPEPDPEPGEPADTVAHGTDLTRADVGLNGISVNDLTPSGPVVTSRDGQVIEGLDIEVSGRDRWAVQIRHDYVTVRNCRIRHSDGAQGIDINGDDALIEHNHLCAWELSTVRRGSSGSNNNVGQRTLESGGTSGTIVRRNYVHFARSAFALRGVNESLVENYVDQLASASGVSPHTGRSNSPGGAALHGTANSTAGGGRNNTIIRNRLDQGSSGGVIIYSRTGSHNNIDVLDNYFPGSGRGYAVYGGRSHNASYYNQNYNIRIEGNRFEPPFRWASTLGRGTNAAVDLSRPGNTFDNNRMVGENQDLPAQSYI